MYHAAITFSLTRKNFCRYQPVPINDGYKNTILYRIDVLPTYHLRALCYRRKTDHTEVKYYNFLKINLCLFGLGKYLVMLRRAQLTIWSAQD